MNVVILGPQGSGKGTQAQLLSEKYRLNRVETGKILRQLAESNEPDAEEIRMIMNDGKLVSDEILQRIIRGKLEKMNGQGVVFDGTPRNTVQYELIKTILAGNNTVLDKVIFLEIPKEETLRRLMNRRTCSVCNRIYNLLTNPPMSSDTCECGGRLIIREDDTESAINKRLAKYEEETVPVLELARKEGLLVTIDGTKQINEIFEDIEHALREVSSGSVVN